MAKINQGYCCRFNSLIPHGIHFLSLSTSKEVCNFLNTDSHSCLYGTWVRKVLIFFKYLFFVAFFFSNSSLHLVYIPGIVVWRSQKRFSHCFFFEQEVAVSGPLAPFDEPVTIAFRGPLNLHNVVWYEGTADDVSQTSTWTRSWVCQSVSQSYALDCGLSRESGCKIDLLLLIFCFSINSAELHFCSVVVCFLCNGTPLGYISYFLLYSRRNEVLWCAFL